MLKVIRVASATCAALALSSFTFVQLPASPTTPSVAKVTPADSSSSSPIVKVSETQKAPHLTITSVGDALLQPADNLTVTASIANPTKKDLSVSSVVLRGQSTASTTRIRLLDFMEGNTGGLTELSAKSEGATIKAGATEEITFTVAREDLKWGSDGKSWGPHGIEVAASIKDGEVLSDRSIVVVAPNYELTPMPTGVVVPLNLSADELASGQALADTIDSNYTNKPAVGTNANAKKKVSAKKADSSKDSEAKKSAKDGDSQADSENASPDSSRISTSLTALSIAGVTAAIQPESLAQATNTLGPGLPQNTGTALSGKALEHFTATAGTELLILPKNDADAGALVHANLYELVLNSTRQASETLSSTNVSARTDVVVGSPQLDRTTLGALTQAGMSGAIVAGDDIRPTGYRYFTPSARADISLTDVPGAASDSPVASSISAVATDPTMSAALAGTLVNDNASAATSNKKSSLDALDSRQTVLGLSAATYRERPNDSRAVLLGIDRAGAPHYGTTDPASASKSRAVAVTDTVSALMQAPWVEPTTVSHMLAAPTPASTREALPLVSEVPGGVSAKVLSDADAATATISSVANLGSGPEFAVIPAKEFGQELMSTAWRNDSPARRIHLKSLQSVATDFSQGLSVNQSSTINIISQSTALPITVTNDLPIDVGIVVELTSADARIKALKPVALTANAKTTSKVSLPIEANGSGNVTVKINITTPTGEQVGKAQSLELRVRADWENVGTLVIAIGLGLVLVFGIVRSVIRKRRPNLKPAAAKDSADDVAYKDPDEGAFEDPAAESPEESAQK